MITLKVYTWVALIAAGGVAILTTNGLAFLATLVGVRLGLPYVLNLSAGAKEAWHRALESLLP